MDIIDQASSSLERGLYAQSRRQLQYALSRVNELIDEEKAKALAWSRSPEGKEFIEARRLEKSQVRGSISGRITKEVPSFQEVCRTCQAIINHPLPSELCGICDKSKPVEGQKRLIEVWIEGYEATGENGKAFKAGEYQASSLAEAFKLWVEEDSSRKAVANFDKMTFWGCRVLDNEAAARKNFG